MAYRHRPYFPINARINKEGYASVESVVSKGSGSWHAIKAAAEPGTIILDTALRPVYRGFVPGSISIGLDGRFAEWAGSLLPYDQTLLLVTEPGQEQESIVRLARRPRPRGWFYRRI